MVKVGDKAPDFTLLDQDGNEWSPAKAVAEKQVLRVIYFYS